MLTTNTKALKERNIKENEIQLNFDQYAFLSFLEQIERI
jgi:hypothetical protein